MGKQELIKEVQRVCCAFDGLAKSQAVGAARNPEDQELVQRAGRTMSMADALGQAERKIVYLIHANWPKEQSDD